MGEEGEVGSPYFGAVLAVRVIKQQQLRGLSQLSH